MWTQELLILVVAERTGIPDIVSTRCWRLRRLAIRLNRPKHIVDCPWPNNRWTAGVQVIQRRIDNLSPAEIILYVDDVDIHLNAKTGPR